LDRRGSALIDSDATYDSAKRPPPFWEELVEAIRYRDLIAQLVSRDVKTRYKRSVLGIAWTMLNPLLMMIVLTLVFSHLFRFEVPHYPIYLVSALILWNFFAQSTIAATHQMRAGGSLLTKVYVPRTVFAIAAVGTGLVNLFLAILPLLFLCVILGVPLTPSLLWLPIPIALVAAFSLGIGLLISTIAVPFPDVIDMYEVVLTAWYFATPIIYPISMLAPDVAAWLPWNPMYHFVELFRDPIYSGVRPPLADVAPAAAFSIFALMLGWSIFSSQADRLTSRL
jgi:ABC-2 type transport system permease protein